MESNLSDKRISADDSPFLKVFNTELREEG